MQETARLVQTTGSHAAAARAALAEHWDGELPVDPARIARKLAIKLIEMPPVGSSAAWPYSGQFSAYDPTLDAPVIRYNRTDSLVRQRFALAHELGHFFLRHGDRARDDPSMFAESVRDPVERAANQFAAELLMPADELQALVQSGKMASVDELYKAFFVSKVAMSFRLSNLSLV